LGAQNTGGGGIDQLVSIENVFGTNFNDSLTGNGANNVFSGLAGNDTLLGGAGNDTLNGGNGNDQLLANHNEGGILNGGAGNDTLRAGNGSATLNGGTGNDYLNGGDSGVLNGGEGDDLLEAGIQLPSIMNGGAGADILRGSGGATSGGTYDFNAVNDSPAGVGRDTIVNFFVREAGYGEQIDLTDIDANSVLNGNQAFTWIGSNPFMAAGQLRYNTTTGILQGSTDGDAAAEFEIQLLGAPALVVGGGGQPHSPVRRVTPCWAPRSEAPFVGRHADREWFVVYEAQCPHR
jgi:Ca2+-binding RTX toxin-like protein